MIADLNTLATNSPLYLMFGCAINSDGVITGLGLASTGEFHTYLATPTRDLAASQSSSQGAVNPRILNDDARKRLQQQLRPGRFGVRLVPQKRWLSPMSYGLRN